MSSKKITLPHSVSTYVGGAAVASLAILSAIYHDRAIFDETRKDILTEKGWPLVGSLPALIQGKDRLHDFLVESFYRLDRLTLTMSALGIPRHIGTIDPANVEHILKHNFENYIKGPEFHSAMNDLFGDGIFNANGEDWKYQRKTASHIFNVKNFRDQFTDVFVHEIDFMSDNILDKATETSELVDFHDLMYKFTLDSFILLGFGVRLNGLASKEVVPFAESFDIAQKNTFQRFVNPIWKVTERIQSVVMPWRRSMNYHLNVVDTFAREVTEKRRVQLAKGEIHTDLLSRFMSARNTKGDLLNNTELRDIVLNFVIAGRDTTAQALSWTLYMLLCHPRVEQKLLNEINENITDKVMHNSPELYETIKNMTYAHAVFYEVLRLYPSVPQNQKFALDNDIWPDGTHVRKGDYILWSPYAQGRCEKVWGPDAKQFNPERWITPQGDLRRESQGQWPAFHAGPRVCLGQNLATLETLVAITFLIKRYKFHLAPNQEITYQISLTLPMMNGIKVSVEKRQQ
ncbi:cytochrome P450 CYP5203 [Phycomyces blakesleeanus]|uniref:Cytochrome P450 CYP5203 n=2 Tax=Phycomyces blakesleeanus TaxID=4837 RepID=A0A167JFV1_PHYB8|nr:cytochrome P450 CYP5203 [Phycomyces blakesleeanus NRRL 1555(-)]OAD65908.1 cytochrome P450 CYP5203 [Phycomyces blakesleeanus NRRL 1555(-)]|eukprot:XP_018283948.1 cytochrome P450 CYP5203 [Phycomyces blakesleeanus NRRL 1555(-)]